MKPKQMAIEVDLSRESRWQGELKATKCLKGLKLRNFPGYYFPNRDEARLHIVNTIPPEALVGFGDSVTLYQLGVLEPLRDRGQRITSPFWIDGDVCHPNPPSVRHVVKKGKEALDADYFLAGINAITLDGRIVNTDGVGNRLAGIMFGPRRVILVAGVNKITADLDEAMARVKNVASPLNAHRHMLKHGLETHPQCAKTGVCVECRNHRACNYTLILEHQLTPRIEVVLVGETLGL